MIRALATLVYGIVVAVLVIAVAVFAAVFVIGLAAKAMLFGEPRATLATKIFQRVTRGDLMGITDNTHNSGGNQE